MRWHYDNSRPIYSQIVEQIERGIVAGIFPPGSGMPSVRMLAVEAEVNPNTMQKALAELENKGLLHTQRTAGRTVTEDSGMIQKLKKKLAEDHIHAFFTGMANLGISSGEAIAMLKEAAGRPAQKQAKEVV
ncbi:MAG: GntR family transcriptional regulator [Clostridiales Family XIII bacterium]|jgi:DNA-binding transcriptional regulator YhcF (GntR family)|nr:GntR family transcriptional regulator [Clostridiales Family XIII bacterium]